MEKFFVLNQSFETIAKITHTPTAIVVNPTCTEKGSVTIKCSVCGEMASRPLEAVTLLALGIRTLSMSPEAVGAVKMAIRSLNLTKFRQYLLSRLDSRQASLREALFSYLKDHHVDLGEM